MTSRAEAREVLDVHAVEFSKTGRPGDWPRKRPPLTREALEAKAILVVSGFAEGLSVVSWVDRLRAAVQAAEP
jgi:hypothetical protein